MDDRFDLTPLDPSAADPARWERLVRSTAARAAEARRQSPVLLQLVAWSGPALAAALGLAVLVWTATFVTGSPTQTASTTEDPAFSLASWASSGEVPATSDVLDLLGGGHDSL